MGNVESVGVKYITRGALTNMAVRAMAPGVTSLSPHLVPVGWGPGGFPVVESDEGPNIMTFNTCT